MANQDGTHRGAERQSDSRRIVSAPKVIASAFVLLWGCATQPGGEPNPVDCSGFPIAVADPTLRQVCYDGPSSPKYGGTHKILDGESDRYFTSISHFKSGFRGYMVKASIREDVGDLSGMTNVEWSGYPLEEAGFEAELFTASPKSNPELTVSCFGFSMYWGNVPGRYELRGPPGYLNVASGLYCEFESGPPMTEERIRTVLRTITVAR